MKIVLSFICSMLFLFSVQSQKSNFINLNYEQKLLNLNPGIHDLEQTYPYDINYKISNYHLNFCVFNQKISWFSGLSFMKINYTVPDRITHYNYVIYLYDDFFEKYPYDTVYQVYQDPADYVATSINLGINNELTYYLSGKNPKTNQSIGLRNELYLFERFEHKFETNDNIQYSESGVVVNEINGPYPNDHFENKFLQVSNTNLSAFYQIRYFPHDAFSFGLRLSAGTSLYSDWQQFKKYSWLSVGAEIGFLAKKSKGAESRN